MKTASIQRLFRKRILWGAVVLLLYPGASILSALGAAPGQENNLPQLNERPAPTPEKPASAESPYRFRDLPRNVFGDQKFLWARPFRPKRSDVPWDAAILGGAAALIAIDRRVGQNLTQSPPGTGYAVSNRAGQFGSGLADAGVAGAFYLAGRWHGNENARVTGLEGFQAVADSLLVVEMLKAVTQRPRPAEPGGRVRIHNADGQFFAGGNSFPSGHAAGAWALATVIARRYRRHAWVPILAYGLAGFDGAARVTNRRHFPSDVFAGSVIGYLIGRHVAHPKPNKSFDTVSSLRLQPVVSAGGGAALKFSWQF